jgi:hypothetical protein
VAVDCLTVDFADRKVQFDRLGLQDTIHVAIARKEIVVAELERLGKSSERNFADHLMVQ